MDEKIALWGSQKAGLLCILPFESERYINQALIKIYPLQSLPSARMFRAPSCPVPKDATHYFILRERQEGCGGLERRESRSAPEGGADFLSSAGVAYSAAGKSGKSFPAVSKFARRPFQQVISHSGSLLEFSEFYS